MEPRLYTARSNLIRQAVIIVNGNKCSEIAEISDRLATRDMGRKERRSAVPYWWGLGPHTCITQRDQGWGLPPYQVASSSIQPFRHNTCAEKWGLLCPPLGEVGLHLTQCRMGRGLPPYQVTSWSSQPFGHNEHGPKIGGFAPFLVRWIPI